MMSNKKNGFLQAWVWMAVAVLLIEAGLALWAGLPGQLSTDSIIQLYEGRTHQTISFNPALMAILLGVLDSLGNAPIGFVLLSQGLFSWAVWLAFGERTSRGRWWQFLLAAVLICNPVVLAYTGIVWKDVLFAHASIALFLLINRWYEQKSKPDILQICVVVVLMTIVIGVRQQGLLFALIAAVWLASFFEKTKLRVLALTIPFVLGPWLLNKTLSDVVQKPFPDGVNVATVGLKILMQYDLVGISANGGTLPARAPSSSEGKALANITMQTPQYDRFRVDTLVGPSSDYWALPIADTVKLWSGAISANFGLYAKHRMDHFSTLLGFEDMRKCLPVHSGISGPVQHSLVEQELTSFLGLQPGMNHSSEYVIRTVWELTKTPLLMHWAYALILLVIAVVLLIQKRYVLLSLVGCCFTYLASYFVLGIACDFRYGYVLTASASVLAVAALFGCPKGVQSHHDLTAALR